MLEKKIRFRRETCVGSGNKSGGLVSWLQSSHTLCQIADDVSGTINASHSRINYNVIVGSVTPTVVGVMEIVVSSCCVDLINLGKGSLLVEMPLLEFSILLAANSLSDWMKTLRTFGRPRRMKSAQRPMTTHGF